MQKSDLIRIRHMLDAAEKAVEFIENKNCYDLGHDDQLSLAIIRLIEIIGEAASRITLEFKDIYPEVPWKSIIGTRNKLIHGYEDVDLDIVWQIVSTDLPVIISTLREIIEKESDKPKYKQ